MRCRTPQYLTALISVGVTVVVIALVVVFEDFLVKSLQIDNIVESQKIQEQEIIKLKIQTLHKVMDICMLWWVSSIVLCLSILGAIWIKQTHIIHHPADEDFFGSLGKWISWLLCLIIIFPTWVMIILIVPYLQVATLTGRWLYLPEFIGVWVSLLIGIAGYFVVFRVWENTKYMILDRKKRG